MKKQIAMECKSLFSKLAATGYCCPLVRRQSGGVRIVKYFKFKKLINLAVK
jgi:hypothetical protein